MSIDSLEVGKKRYFLVSFLNGLVIIYRADNGAPVCELAAHNRQVSALACGKKDNRAVFATAGDDTFVNLWEVLPNTSKGDEHGIEVKLMQSHRIADSLLTGVCFFAQDQVIASVYDQKNLIALL